MGGGSLDAASRLEHLEYAPHGGAEPQLMILSGADRASPIGAPGATRPYGSSPLSPRSAGWDRNYQVSPPRPVYPGGAIAEVADLEAEVAGKAGRSRPSSRASSPTSSTTGWLSFGQDSVTSTPTSIASRSPNPMKPGKARDSVRAKLKFARQQLSMATSAVLSARRLIDAYKQTGGDGDLESDRHAA